MESHGEYQDFVTGFVGMTPMFGAARRSYSGRGCSLVFTDDGSNSIWRVTYTVATRKQFEIRSLVPTTIRFRASETKESVCTSTSRVLGTQSSPRQRSHYQWTQTLFPHFFEIGSKSYTGERQQECPSRKVRKAAIWSLLKTLADARMEMKGSRAQIWGISPIGMPPYC